MSHTPGPWKVAENLFGNTASYEVYANVETKSGKGGYTRICQITSRDQKDDSALIAAAPEMLEALEDILSGWLYIRQVHGDLSGVGWDRAQEKAESAIGKARGNVIKYVSRAGRKDDYIQDLLKARAYLDKAIDLEHERRSQCSE